MRTRARAALVLVLAAGTPLPGCESEGSSPGAGASSEARAEAREIFATRCAPCHGPGGRGDGPSAASLRPRPASFADSDWQRSASDDQIERAIREGGAALGKSAAMPPNPDLAGRPAVVTALLEHIRGLAPR